MEGGCEVSPRVVPVQEVQAGPGDHVASYGDVESYWSRESTARAVIG